MGTVFTNPYLCKYNGIVPVYTYIFKIPPACPQTNYNNRCSTKFSAYLPSITVCRSNLY